MAPYPKQPLVDLQNPCYCPSLPARAYIHTLRQSLLPAGAFAPLAVVNHFTKALAQSVHTPGLASGDKGVLDSDSESSSSSLSSFSGSSATTSSLASSDGSGNDEFHSAFSDPQALSNAPTTLTGTAPPGTSTGILDVTATTDNISFDLNHLKRFTGLRDSHLLARPPRRRKRSSVSNRSGNSSDSNSDSDKSDIRGPSKRARSMLGTLERSFKVRLKRKILNYDVSSSTRSLDMLPAKSPQLPMLEPYHPSSPILRLVDSSTPPPPGLGKEKSDLDELIQEILDWKHGAYIDPEWNVQDIVDYLAEGGLIRAPLMKIMGRFSELRELSLTDSLEEIHNYNPRGIKEVISELHTQGAFRGLVHLKIECVPLDDDDVLCFHHLTGLRYLNLRDTCITNTAIYLLSSHRHTLTHLDICCNWDINDDSIVPLLSFQKLVYLNVSETQITMRGLRRYAKAIHEAKRVIHIKIPEECEQQLQNPNYLIDILPPLINDPEGLQNLTLAELRMNLNAHWEVDGEIVMTGSKSELRERLRELLERREGDLLVREMVENRRKSNNRGDDE